MRTVVPMKASQRRKYAGNLCRTRSGRTGKDARRRAVIRDVRDAAAGTPVIVIGAEGYVEWHVPLIPIAQAAAAAALATTIVVRDDVVEPVGGVVTGSHPGDGRLHGPRRTG